MEVVANATPLLLPRQNELLPAPLQIGSESGRVGRRRQPARQVVEQALFFRSEGLRVAPMAEDERSDTDPVVDEGERGDTGLSLADSHFLQPIQLDGHVGKA